MRACGYGPRCPVWPSRGSDPPPVELKKAQEKSIIRAQSGTRGGNAQALKTKEPDVANATVLPEHSSEPEPEKIDNPSGYSRPKADALPVQEAFDEWNATATRRRLPVAKSLTASRRKQIKARLAARIAVKADFRAADGNGAFSFQDTGQALNAAPACPERIMGALRGENAPWR